MQSEFGLMGLGVMGKSLSRNLGRNGFRLSLYNRHVDELEVDVAKNCIAQYDELSEAQGFDNVADFVSSLASPRKIFLMVPAGKSTDEMIDHLTPLLDAGDIIIDGGNAFYKDTQRRYDNLLSKGIRFIGSGVSGGEKGALMGPSIMPGGSQEAYEIVAPFLTAIAAKDDNAKACCAFIGKGGAGHFVKMIHNGIEYAEMQLIAELISYYKSTGLTYPEIADVFSDWESFDLGSYLLEISIDILRSKDENGFILDQILDKAGNKGTGGWSTTAASELGVPGDMISSALFARYISAFKQIRETATSKYDTPEDNTSMDIDHQEIAQAYKIARIINHHQGFNIIAEASQKNNWDIDMSALSRIWTNGCIIRSQLMKQLEAGINENSQIMMQSQFVDLINKNRYALNKFCVAIINRNLAAPCFLAAYSFMNAFTTARGSAYIIQAQRDYFGAHTYQKLGDDTNQFYHTDWESLKS